MATSPLENLLIEHPSMSVYHHSLTDELPSTSLSPVTIEDDQEDEATPNEEMIQIVDYMKQRFRRMRKSATSYNNSNNKEKQLKYQSSSNSRKQELAVPTAATPTVPHLKSQKVGTTLSHISYLLVLSFRMLPDPPNESVTEFH